MVVISDSMKTLNTYAGIFKQCEPFDNYRYSDVTITFELNGILPVCKKKKKKLLKSPSVGGLCNASFKQGPGPNSVSTTRGELRRHIGLKPRAPPQDKRS